VSFRDSVPHPTKAGCAEIPARAVVAVWDGFPGDTTCVSHKGSFFTTVSKRRPRGVGKSLASHPSVLTRHSKPPVPGGWFPRSQELPVTWSIIQFKCARNCLAAGYVISLGTPTRSLRYTRLGGTASEAEALGPVVHTPESSCDPSETFPVSIRCATYRSAASTSTWWSRLGLA